MLQRCIAALLLALWVAPAPAVHAGSLRFFGNSRDQIDRVKIRIDAPPRPVDVGAGNFTIEFWLLARPGENSSPDCSPVADGWIYGNIVVDRDVYGGGHGGDYGISLAGDRVSAGVSRGFEGVGLCSASRIDDRRWHHVALTRHAGTGLVRLFVDGVLQDQAIGPVGDVSYRDGRVTEYPRSDPFLVLGAEKHDVGIDFPSFRGWFDELRISRRLRYRAQFAVPAAPFVADASTVGLYHFDEGAGTVAFDTSRAAGGPSHGRLRVGGDPVGPRWSPRSPFAR